MFSRYVCCRRRTIIHLLSMKVGTLEQYRAQLGDVPVPQLAELMKQRDKMKEYQLLTDPDFKRKHGYQI